MPVKPLSFKGDKKAKKRKRTVVDAAEKFGTNDNDDDNEGNPTTSTSLVPRADEPETADDSWVTAEAASDLTGPIIIVLPSEPPTCIASDSNGKVFASPLENIVDGDPSTAEPHDVRQVWVANRVAGMEGFSFKGSHGK
jgi:protein FRG1